MDCSVTQTEGALRHVVEVMGVFMIKKNDVCYSKLESNKHVYD